MIPRPRLSGYHLPCMGTVSWGAAEELPTLVKRRSRRIEPVPAAAAESGSLPRKPQGVLFDVYGTLLVRIGEVHPHPAEMRRAVKALIRRHKLPIAAHELAASLATAIRDEQAALRSQGSTNPEVSIERIWARLFPEHSDRDLREMIVEYELATHPAWPMPGCRRLLLALARRGMRLGVISNAQFYTPIFLSVLLGASLEELGFTADLCLYSCDFGVAKPDVALFDIARQRLARMGLSSEAVVMVGNDPLNDVEPATRSGFMTVLATLDARSQEATETRAASVRPDAVIRHLRSLESLIDPARRTGSRWRKEESHV